MAAKESLQFSVPSQTISANGTTTSATFSQRGADKVSALINVTSVPGSAGSLDCYLQGSFAGSDAATPIWIDLIHYAQFTQAGGAKMQFGAYNSESDASTALPAAAASFDAQLAAGSIQPAGVLFDNIRFKFVAASIAGGGGFGVTVEGKIQ